MIVKAVTGKDVEILPYPRAIDFGKKIREAAKRYFEEVR
jgi:hypothetical protein